MSEIGQYTTAFFGQTYWKEFERRDRLNASLSLPAGVVILLAGVVGYYLQNLPEGTLDLWARFFVGSVVVLSLFLLISVYFLVRAYFNHRYGYIASPKEIEEYIDALYEYYHELEPDDLRVVVESDFRAFLAREYARCGAVNTNNNDRKSGFVHRANAFIVASLITLVVSLLPYFVTYYRQPRIQKIQIMNEGGGDYQSGRSTKEPSTSEPGPEPAAKASTSSQRETQTTRKSVSQGEQSATEAKVTDNSDAPK